MEVFIWDYLGEEVLSIPDTTVFRGTLSFPWDGLDNDGDAVPSGYYPTFSRCLDSRGEFTFAGHYMNWESREESACEWPLWIKELEPAPTTRVLTYSPFPLITQTWLIDIIGDPIALVTFKNPFLVRVQAPGMKTFEFEMTLVDGQFTDIPVEFVPAS
jgi:hypothetical protein